MSHRRRRLAGMIFGVEEAFDRLGRARVDRCLATPPNRGGWTTETTGDHAVEMDVLSVDRLAGDLRLGVETLEGLAVDVGEVGGVRS